MGLGWVVVMVRVWVIVVTLTVAGMVVVVGFGERPSPPRGRLLGRRAGSLLGVVRMRGAAVSKILSCYVY